MSGYELFQQRDALLRELSEYNAQMQKYGIEQANAESDYKVELAKTALKLKDEGQGATMISMTVYGTGDVPKLRLKRDVAQVMHDAAQEKINSIKLTLRMIEAQIDREWGQAKRTV